MALSDDQVYKIYAAFAGGATAREVSDGQDISYATALRYKTQYDQALSNGNLDALIDLSKVAREQLAAQLVANTPEGLRSGIKDALGGVLTSLDMADTLKTNLQASANQIAERINILLRKTETPSELLVLSEALCNLQNAFFNKNMTQVNVQNNYGGGEDTRYKGLLDDTPKSDN